MANAQYNCKVNASYDILWNALMDEVDHPDKYSQTIQKVEILERFHNGVLRSLCIPDAEVRERVVYNYDSGIITSSIIGHPAVAGTISKSLKRTGNMDSPMEVECNVEWDSIDEGIGAMIRRNVESFIMERLELVKKNAESQ